MPDICNFILRSPRSAKIAIAAPGTPDDFRRSRRSAYKIAKCVAGLKALLCSWLEMYLIHHPREKKKEKKNKKTKNTIFEGRVAHASRKASEKSFSFRSLSTSALPCRSLAGLAIRISCLLGCLRSSAGFRVKEKLLAVYFLLRLSCRACE